MREKLTLTLFLIASLFSGQALAQAPDETPPVVGETVVEIEIPAPADEAPVKEKVVEKQGDTKTPEPKEPSANEAPSSGQKMSLGACMGHRRLYAQSAARKLHRALRSKSWKTKKTSLSGPIEIERRGSKIEFEVLPEEDGHAYAFYTSVWRETYVLVMTKQGPVIGAHRWPTKKELRSGKVACEPVSSRIAFPNLGASIDVNPFNMWGVRVVWMLPSRLNSRARKTKVYDALTRAVKTMKR